MSSPAQVVAALSDCARERHMLEAVVDRLRVVTDALDETIKWDQERHPGAGPSLIDATAVLGQLRRALDGAP